MGQKHLSQEIVAPDAASMFESLRAFGYELPTALADLVDNSIFAGARNIWIDFEWDGQNSTVCITDDGCGMTEPELVNAMRPGSRNPREQRDPEDLGRFGLGLKTASLSQGRRLTVRSRQRGKSAVTRCWDLDHIAETDNWYLLSDADAAAEKPLSRLADLKHGTSVLWQKLDRLTASQKANDEAEHQMFLAKINESRQHLGMVFHQLMSGSSAIRLFINEHAVKAWDPFLESHPATHKLPGETLRCKGSKVRVQSYILPHLSKLTRAQHEAAAGPHAWNAHQGFYVYRNCRLLVAGDWLGFGWAKEEHHKLARIAVELPNSLDHEWQIDVTKSRALPPPGLREDLRRIGSRTRAEAKRIYTHRGAKLTPQAEAARTLLWEPRAKHNKTFYLLNREHPLVKQVFSCCTDRPALNALLRMVEETVPVQHITIDNSEKPDQQPMPFEGTADSQVREVMNQMYRSLRAAGYGPTEARNRLRTHWPFELFPALLAALEEEETK